MDLGKHDWSRILQAERARCGTQEDSEPGEALQRGCRVALVGLPFAPEERDCCVVDNPSDVNLTFAAEWRCRGGVTPLRLICAPC
jgi:hypothetical protein